MAPIFIMIGGPGEGTERWMHEGAWIHYAEQFGALCFQVEHRYYGKSRPTSDLSTKNLAYLTSEQAFIYIYLKQEYNLSETHKWIEDSVSWVLGGMGTRKISKFYLRSAFG